MTTALVIEALRGFEDSAATWRRHAKEAKDEGGKSSIYGEEGIPSHVLASLRAEVWASAATDLRMRLAAVPAPSPAPAAEPSKTRTADEVLNEDYTYVDPKFALAFREGWLAHKNEARAASPSPAVAPLDGDRLDAAMTAEMMEAQSILRSVDQSWEKLAFTLYTMLTPSASRKARFATAYAEASEQAASPGEGEPADA